MNPNWSFDAWLQAYGAALVVYTMIPVALILGLQNILYLVQIFASLRERIANPLKVGTHRDLWALSEKQAIPVSIIAPAFNEELTIVDSVRALLSVNYPAFEIIVVNDGSNDNTAKTLIDAYRMIPRPPRRVVPLDHQPVRQVYVSPEQPNLIFIDKENGRKADAVNAGLAHARNPLVCVIDADSLIDKDAMLRVVQPFLDDDGSLLAVGGNIRLTNGCDVRGGKVREIGFPKEWIARFQVLEYLRAFMVSRVSASRWSVLMLISGAFGVFRRDAVLEVGGFEHGTVGEDLELVVRLHRKSIEKGKPGRIAYVADALCWTEAPFDYRGISNQRARWTQGGLEVLAKHRHMLFNPRYGRPGMIGMPMVLLETLLTPLAELVSYVVLVFALVFGIKTWAYAFALVVFSALLGSLVSLLCIGFEELQQRRYERGSHVALLVLCAFLECFGYRQLNFWFRLRGIGRFLKKEQSWAAVQRRGFEVGNAAAGGAS